MTRIRIGLSGQHIDIDAASSFVNLWDVFSGVGIDTDQGHFGIAQRDGGIEVMLNGGLVWRSRNIEEKTELKQVDIPTSEVTKRYVEIIDMFCRALERIEGAEDLSIEEIQGIASEALYQHDLKISYMKRMKRMKRLKYNNG